MEKTEYYSLTIVRTAKISREWDLISTRIAEINNDSHRYLYLDSIVEDSAKHCRKVLMHFYYIVKIDRKDKPLSEDVEELSDVFGCRVCLVMANQKDKEADMNGLFRAKKLMAGKHQWNICGEEESRLNLLTAEEIISEADKLTGFSGYKQFFHSYATYVDNMKRLGMWGHYNVVIVNSCGANENFFVEQLYSLLAAKGIIADQRIIRGDLEDAVKTAPNTAYMYSIQQRWDFGKKDDFFFGLPQESAFHLLERRRNVYVTSMDRQQYEKAMELDYFKLMFTHSMDIKDLTKGEKAELLAQESKLFGFAIDKESFQGSNVLKLPYSTLKAQLLSVVQRQLSNQNTQKYMMTALDFEELSGKTDDNSNALEELESLIGLSSVKQCIKEIAALLKKRGRGALPCLHMVFRGNPGTGKTTVARIIGRLFGEIGIIKDGEKFIETDRDGLVSQYLGGTASKTAGVVKDALGGVLFIDEAYALSGSNGYDYGNEAISTLVKRLEDYRNDFVCIMAGYTKEMDKMLDVNPGLRDRIQFYIDFPDYSTDELVKIFEKYALKEAYSLSPAATALITKIFGSLQTGKGANFSNARFVRKVFERVRIKQALRADDNSIEAADIESVFAEDDMNVLIHARSNKSSIGFSA